MTEEWRPVVGYEGYYEVSSLGRVRSVDRGIEIERYGTTYTASLKGVVLSPVALKSGHLRVKMTNSKSVSVHRLVAEAFLGPAPEGRPFVLHRNDVPDDNSVENLYWGTRSENTFDSIANGRYRNGNTGKTVCSRGHEFTEKNTYRYKGGRQCRECRRHHDMKRRGRNV